MILLVQADVPRGVVFFDFLVNGPLNIFVNEEADLDKTVICDFFETIRQSTTCILKVSPDSIQRVSKDMCSRIFSNDSCELIRILQELYSTHCDFIKISSNYYVRLFVNIFDSEQNPF